MAVLVFFKRSFIPLGLYIEKFHQELFTSLCGPGKTTALLEAVLIQPAGVPTAGGTVHGLRGLLQELP